MPRPGPRRPNTALRLSAEGVARVDDLARQAGLIKGNGEPNRSEMIRRLLAAAVNNPQIVRDVTRHAG